MANVVANVSAGKPNASGAIWWAPLNSTLPPDATTALDAAFACLGYVSEDGLTHSKSKDVETVHAWGGDAVLATETNHTETFQFTLIEILNTEVLEFIYGSGNVSGTLATGITVKANTTEAANCVLVIELAQRNGAVARYVLPNAKLTELGDVTYTDTAAVGYPATVTALPGGFASDNDAYKEYILRT